MTFAFYLPSPASTTTQSRADDGHAAPASALAAILTPPRNASLGPVAQPQGSGAR